MVIAFDDCIARPDLGDGGSNLLSDHLLAVANSWGDPSGDHPSRLRFLAGLLHDGGKARASWQEYIQFVANPDGCRSSGKRKGVNHAPLGSALFFWCAYNLLKAWRLSLSDVEGLRLLTLQLVYDIYDHHGEMRDMEAEPPWASTLSKDDLEECDLAGLFSFINRFFPELSYKPNASEIFSWLDVEAFPLWEKWVMRSQALLRRQLDLAERRYHVAAANAFRLRTSGLITADRYDASRLSTSHLSAEDAAMGLKRLSKLCEEKHLEALEKGRGAISEKRRIVQDECCRAYEEAPDKMFYTLVLPTGLGKTLSALRIALTACASGRCNKIIYVAPYLSILSQATQEIRRATGLEVLQHHHLSMMEQETDDSLILESWQAPVVTTTFNQLFRGLFPRRAQQTLRLSGLRNAFLIIDEPQVISGEVWNLFLHMLEAAMMATNSKVLFSTATLPPLDFGLASEVLPLAPVVESPGRYQIQSIDDALDENGVASLALEEFVRTGSVAVIVNTVRDAATIYSLIKERINEEGVCYSLTGCMTPLHKMHRIGEIAAQLQAGHPTIVVCTQILECGVDLSFRSILRARSTIPSIVQAAGRANRHGEGEEAMVTIFKFLREGEVDTRRYVYGKSVAVEETDKSLTSHPAWGEPTTGEMVEEYYGRVLSRNTNTAALESLIEAACGKWSALAGKEPFGGDYPHIDTFIPFGENFLSPGMKELLLHFAPGGCEELYEKYLNRRFRASLSFIERKRFMGLLQNFLVSLDPKTAEQIVVLGEEASIARIVDKKYYSEETGLAHRVGRAGEVSDNFL